MSCARIGKRVGAGYRSSVLRDSSDQNLYQPLGGRIHLALLNSWHKSLNKPLLAGKPAELSPIRFHTVPDHGCRSPRRPLVGFAYTKPPKPNIYWPYNPRNSRARPVPVHLPADRAAAFQLHQVVPELFFIQFRAVWWETPKVRPKPRALLRSSAALSSLSLVS